MTKRPLSLTANFSDLAPDYDVVLSDVWGVVHNGVNGWPDACAALTRFRARGGVVVLISNAPRPGERLKVQLDGFEVPRGDHFLRRCNLCRDRRAAGQAGAASRA
jgi:hypothetical protein